MGGGRGTDKGVSVSMARDPFTHSASALACAQRVEALQVAPLFLPNAAARRASSWLDLNWRQRPLKQSYHQGQREGLPMTGGSRDSGFSAASSEVVPL